MTLIQTSGSDHVAPHNSCSSVQMSESVLQHHATGRREVLICMEVQLHYLEVIA